MDKDEKIDEKTHLEEESEEEFLESKPLDGSEEEASEEFGDDVLSGIKQHDLEDEIIVEENPNEDSSKDTRNLLVMVGIIVLIFGAFLGVRYIMGDRATNQGQLSIDELHELNLDGKLKVDQGYIYNGFSFVFHSER